MSRVTVLVAAYNAENFLAECLDSLLAQTFRNLQILCVDDASTDSTGCILKEYSESDSRISVLTNSVNVGQAVSRNRALEMADGDYVAMLDADDTLSPDAICLAVRALDADRSVGAALFHLDYVRDGIHTPFPMKSTAREWSGQQAFRLSLDWSIHGLYVARIELYRKWPFDTACLLYSDDNTTRMHYLHSDKVVLTDGVYHYRQHESNMTGSISVRRMDVLEANASMDRQLRAGNHPRDVLAIFELSRWYNLIGTCFLWLENREILSEDRALARMKQAYCDIDRSLLPFRVRFRPGYMPMPCFRLFFIQEKIFLALRRMIGR